MNAEQFLKNKGIKKPTYEGVRLVDSEMGTYRIVDLLNEYAESKVENLHIPFVSGSFVLSREGAVDTIYWNGNEWQEGKYNCPTYSYWKANEYAKVLNCHFTDAE